MTHRAFARPFIVLSLSLALAGEIAALYAQESESTPFTARFLPAIGSTLAPSAPLPEKIDALYEESTSTATDESAAGITTDLDIVPASALDSLEMLDQVAANNPTGAKSAAPKKPAKPSEPPKPYKGVFYDNDFSYLDKPGNKFFYFGDSLKRIHCGDCWVMDFGGEYRARYQHESNLRGSNLSGLSDSFLLHRTRLFANADYSNAFRLYAEAIDANSEFEDFPPRTIEENRFDALNLFGDALLLDTGEGMWTGRVGRQELLYGEQRLISPLDWANTRRTFDGANIFYRGSDWNVDGFWARPVPFAQHVNSDSNFDSSDDSQEFIGLYSTYKGKKDQTYDFYFLRFAEYEGPGTFFAPTDADPMLFGARWQGKQDCYLWDFEGGYQFGEWGTLDQTAGYFTAGLGREWAKNKYKPKVYLYYDYASGDQDPTDDKHQTFFQYFPLVHKYFGFCDLVARQNIHDLNFPLTLQTSKQTQFLIWHHIFWLDSARDALYNAAGAPIRFDPTGSSGTYVGQETDVTWLYNYNPRMDVLFGYSHFWPGTFVNNTTPPGVGTEVDFFYTQFTVRF